MRASTNLFGQQPLLLLEQSQLFVLVALLARRR
jgi:hypothetical protein